MSFSTSAARLIGQAMPAELGQDWNEGHSPQQQEIEYCFRDLFYSRPRPPLSYYGSDDLDKLTAKYQQIVKTCTPLVESNRYTQRDIRQAGYEMALDLATRIVATPGFKELAPTLQHKRIQEAWEQVMGPNSYEDNWKVFKPEVEIGTGLIGASPIWAPLTFFVLFFETGSAQLALGEMALTSSVFAAVSGPFLATYLLVKPTHVKWNQIEDLKEVASAWAAELPPRPVCTWEVQGNKTNYICKE